MPQYESIVVLPPELGNRGVKEMENKFSEILKKFKGKIRTTEDWGIRRLTYTIKKNSKGQFVYLNYDATADSQSEISRNLNIDERIWRYINVRLEDDYDYAKAKQSFMPEMSDDRGPRRGFGGPRGGRGGGRGFRRDDDGGGRDFERNEDEGGPEGQGE